MLNHGNVLIIEENIEKRNQLKIIFDFIGEPCLVINAKKLESINHQYYTAILIGLNADVKIIKNVLQTLENKQISAPIVLYGSKELLSSLTDMHLSKITSRIESPLSYEKVLKALHYCQISSDSNLNDSKVSTIGLFHDLVGNAPLIQKARKLVDHVAKSDANVLVLGGSGTGKEIAARCIHNRSSRKNKPFVPINCGAIPSELLESELFGHEKGAFTGALSARKGRFELANQGTLFLDEIGDMPLNMQVKLLRVLQEQSFERIGCNKTIKVNVRIIAATHHDLEALIKDGKFREDLYYRLNVFPIKMPALKDRSEDILLLINELSYRMKENNIPVAKFMPDSVSLLKNYPWPGNVRELANLVERLSIIYPNGIIGENELPKRFKKHCGDLNTVKVVKSSEPEPVACDNTIQVEEDFIRGIDLKKHLVETELTLITQALDETNWVVAKAANYLNMRRTTLVEKMKKYGISRPTKAC